MMENFDWLFDKNVPGFNGQRKLAYYELRSSLDYSVNVTASKIRIAFRVSRTSQLTIQFR